MKRVIALLIVLSFAFVTAMANSPPVEKATPTTIIKVEKIQVLDTQATVTAAPVGIRFEDRTETTKARQFSVTRTGDFRQNPIERFVGLALENRARADPNG